MLRTACTKHSVRVEVIVVELRVYVTAAPLLLLGALDRWLSAQVRPQIPELVELYHTITVVIELSEQVK